MEKQPFYQSESADSGKGSKEGSKPSGFNFVPISTSVERAEPKHAEAPRPVERLPLEGVIDWRRADEELRRRPEDSKHEESHEKDDDDDSEEKDSTSSRKPVKPIQQPARRPEQAIHEPRPLAEVIAEAHAEQHKEGDNEEAAEAQQVQADEVEGEHAQAVHQAVPSFNTLTDFPAVAPRAEEYAQPQQGEAPAGPSVQTYEQPPVQAAPLAAEQIWYNTEDDDAAPLPPVQQPQQQQVFAAAQPGGPAAPNVYQAPAAANAGGNQPPVPPVGPGAPGVGPNFNQPPVQPGYNYNQMPPYNPNNPAVANAGYNVAPGMPNAAPVMPIERPAVAGANRDPRVGPVAALLGLEYLARKRADRKLERRVNERSDDRMRKMEQSRAVDSRIMQERQRQFAAEQQRQADELRRARYAGEQPTQAPTETQQAYAGGLPRPFEAAPSGVEYAPAGGAVRAEAPRPFAAPAEHAPQNRQEIIPPVQNVEGQPNVSAEDLQVQQNQRVEHSAWHNIVVDEHGHEVAGAIHYGEGFQRERQQEAIRDRVAANPMGGGSGASQGGMIAAGSPLQDQYGNPLHPGALPAGLTNPALPQGQGHADPAHQLPPTTKQQSNVNNPWFWLMLLLIVAAFFTAALV